MIFNDKMGAIDPATALSLFQTFAAPSNQSAPARPLLSETLIKSAMNQKIILGVAGLGALALLLIIISKKRGN